MHRCLQIGMVDAIQRNYIRQILLWANQKVAK